MIPKQRRKFEQDFCTKLVKWLKANALDIYRDNYAMNFGPIEAKVSYDKRFSLVSGFKKYQLKNLMIAKHGAAVYKDSDSDFRSTRPWDINCYTRSMPAVAIMWYRELNRARRVFYLIDPERLVNMIKLGKKSITEEDAIAISFRIGYIKQ